MLTNSIYGTYDGHMILLPSRHPIPGKAKAALLNLSQKKKKSLYIVLHVSKQKPSK